MKMHYVVLIQLLGQLLGHGFVQRAGVGHKGGDGSQRHQEQVVTRRVCANAVHQSHGSVQQVVEAMRPASN